MRELIGLRLYGDALRILRSFARQIEARRVPGLLREFSGALLRSGFRASGKAA
jgi:hypothetical protein